MPDDFLSAGASKGREGQRKRERPHSFCPLNEKEMKTSVSVTEFRSGGALGRIMKQGYGGEHRIQTRRFVVCMVQCKEHWTGRTTGRASNLTSATHHLCGSG